MYFNPFKPLTETNSRTATKCDQDICQGDPTSESDERQGLKIIGHFSPINRCDPIKIILRHSLCLKSDEATIKF